MAFWHLSSVPGGSAVTTSEIGSSGLFTVVSYVYISVCGSASPPKLYVSNGVEGQADGRRASKV